MFKEYALKERVLHALDQKGFTNPTQIQAAALPKALEGQDILGQARTGTGKTLAFALPIANRLEPDSTRGRAPRALVLAPTRELALQVAGELEWIAPHLQVVTVYGGTGYGRQADQLKRGADVVVATPGRAIDYLEQGILNLSSIEVAVLDEADEMLSMGFEEDVERILAATPEGRQTMLFSATLPHWAKRLSEQYLHNPVHVNVVTEEEVTYHEVAIEAPLASRLSVLSDVLHAHAGARAIVFTHTKAEVDELAQALTARGNPADAIHGDLNQVQRERVVDRFRNGQITVLVGTNVAARGLDIPEVDLVVHYRLPDQTDVYQHRSGRTGRAGRAGTVVLLYGPRERRELTMLERAVKRSIERAAPPRPEEVLEAKLTGLLTNARNQGNEHKAVWRDVAERWVREQDTDAIAGLLAMLLGGAPADRSLQTGEEGWVTMLLAGRVLNVPQVVRLLKGEGIKDLGRIALAHDGAYVDVRPDEAQRYEGRTIDGFRLVRATEVKDVSAQPERARKGKGTGTRYKGRSNSDFRR
jgi:ATP-dependent RNA helicase DeaD